MNQAEPVTIVLSREELLLALRLLQAASLPGLDADPAGTPTPEQMELALFVASRGLRARQLARLDASGRLELHGALLTAVGVCAYAQNTLFAYHWPGNGETLTRYFAHLRDERIVAHTRPEDVLHQFALLPSREKLWLEVLAFCQYSANGSAATDVGWTLTLPATEFVQVREWAEDGQMKTAVAHLVNRQIATDTAQAFVAALGQNRRVTIFQTLKQPEAETVRKRDFTLVQGEDHAWIIVPESGDTAVPGKATTLHIKTTNQAELLALLTDSIT